MNIRHGRRAIIVMAMATEEGSLQAAGVAIHDFFIGEREQQARRNGVIPTKRAKHIHSDENAKKGRATMIS